MNGGGRSQGLAALGAGLVCLGGSVALAAAGMIFPVLVIFGALGVGLGAVLVIWGASFRTMPASQKVPAALIALAVVGLAAVPLLRWLGSLSAR